MKTYKDLQNFNNWSEREKNQFSIKETKNINAYLVPSPDIFIEKNDAC